MRTFIALEIPYQLREDLASAARVLQASVRGKYVPRENYHLTLAFPGEVPQTMLELVQGLMDQAVAQTAEYYDIKLQPDGLGSFGRNNNATLWMGFAKDPALMELAEHLRDQINKAGFFTDKKAFLPHVTLARHAQLTAGELAGIPFPEPARGEYLTLFKSDLDPSGATYEPLYSIPLSLVN